ncbi:hypothetical protein [Pantoea ananatis]|uniref:RipA family octameric membrane protein n=1 Tax=Pantoea ananas TaxID=553 RepID=UPI0023B16837|nr:hypothetical protein [Pantoea ananatis]
MENKITVRAKDSKYLSMLLGKDIKEGAILATCSPEKLVESVDYMKIKEAYSKAHDIRKFEIDLYWKRANYFWVFMTAISGLLGFSFNSDIIYIKLLSPALSIMGFIFGLAFLAANQGSKFWQENWERNLDMLEFYVSGDLYKITAKLNLTKPSVSKINIYLAKTLCLLWIVVFIYSLSFSFFSIDNTNYSFIFICIYSFVSIAISISFWNKVRNSSASSYKAEFEKRNVN